jgi:hypothetical protein
MSLWAKAPVPGSNPKSPGSACSRAVATGIGNANLPEVSGDADHRVRRLEFFQKLLQLVEISNLDPIGQVGDSPGGSVAVEKAQGAALIDGDSLGADEAADVAKEAGVVLASNANSDR